MAKGLLCDASGPRTPENLREAGPEIAEFEAAVASFEAEHPLEELHSIVELSADLTDSLRYNEDLSSEARIEALIRIYEKEDPAQIPGYRRKIAAVRAIVLSPEDKRKYKIIIAARKAIVPIGKMLDTLKKETNISIEKSIELSQKYKRLTNAIGNISGSHVDHDRDV